MVASPSSAGPEAAGRGDRPALIGLDWGAAALRGWLFDAGGRVLERREAAAGVPSVPDGRFREAFETLCAAWIEREPKLPVIACGMIGSRGGWREAGLVRAPAGRDALAGRLTVVDDLAGRTFRIVPGLVARGHTGSPDVMHGGETQVFGALHGRDALFVVPGTHCRWVEVRDRRIVALRSYMTGEIYALLCGHSALAAACGDPDDSPKHQADALHAFDVGVDHAAAQPSALAHQLCAAHSEALLGGLATHQLPAYLSGLLIGTEVRDATGWCPHDLTPTLVARSILAARYARAMHRLGVRGKVADRDSAATGLFAIARAADLPG